jgi:hypothetical protein
MLRNVVVHLHNEQPLLADLPNEPSALDTCLVCTNLRTMSGKAPIFVDRGDSTFVFPLAHIRFIEVHAESYVEGGVGGPAEPSERVRQAQRLSAGTPANGGRARVGDGAPGQAWPSGDAEPPADQSGSDPEEGELLRRVRDA